MLSQHNIEKAARLDQPNQSLRRVERGSSQINDIKVKLLKTKQLNEVGFNSAKVGESGVDAVN